MMLLLVRLKVSIKSQNVLSLAGADAGKKEAVVKINKSRPRVVSGGKSVGSGQKGNERRDGAPRARDDANSF